MINEFCWYLEHKSRRLVHCVHQTDIVRFLLLFKQYGVKILITSFWDTQYNFPDIDSTNPRKAAVHNKFLNFLLENSLSQPKTKVTRPISNCVLDLVATTCHQLISNVEVVPGNSDHNIVLFDINMNPKVQRKPPHKIYNFNRADLEKLKGVWTQLLFRNLNFAFFSPF